MGHAASTKCRLLSRAPLSLFCPWASSRSPSRRSSCSARPPTPPPVPPKPQPSFLLPALLAALKLERPICASWHANPHAVTSRRASKQQAVLCRSTVPKPLNGLKAASACALHLLQRLQRLQRHQRHHLQHPVAPPQPRMTRSTTSRRLRLTK